MHNNVKDAKPAIIAFLFRRSALISSGVQILSTETSIGICNRLRNSPAVLTELSVISTKYARNIPAPKDIIKPINSRGNF